MNDVSSVRVGQVVPAFELETYDPVRGDFGTFSLAATQASGRWTILVFYPADFTFVCPTELADLAAKHEGLKALGAEVVGISTDTKFSHLAWLQAEKLLAGVKYTMAADPTGRVSRLMGGLRREHGPCVAGHVPDQPGGVAGGERGQLLQRGPERRRAAEEDGGERVPCGASVGGLSGEVDAGWQDAEARQGHGGQGVRGVAVGRDDSGRAPARLQRARARFPPRLGIRTRQDRRFIGFREMAAG